MNVPNPTFPPPPNLSARWTLSLKREFEDITIHAPGCECEPPRVEITPHKGTRWYTTAMSFVIWLSLLAWTPWWTGAQFMGQCAGPVLLLWWLFRHRWEGSQWRGNVAWIFIWLVVGAGVYLLRSML